MISFKEFANCGNWDWEQSAMTESTTRTSSGESQVRSDIAFSSSGLFIDKSFGG